MNDLTCISCCTLTWPGRRHVGKRVDAVAHTITVRVGIAIVVVVIVVVIVVVVVVVTGCGGNYNWRRRGRTCSRRHDNGGL